MLSGLGSQPQLRMMRCSSSTEICRDKNTVNYYKANFIIDSLTYLHCLPADICCVSGGAIDQREMRHAMILLNIDLVSLNTLTSSNLLLNINGIIATTIFQPIRLLNSCSNNPNGDEQSQG